MYVLPPNLSPQSDSIPGRRSARVATNVLIAIALLLALALAAGAARRWRKPQLVAVPASVNEDPRLTYATPYRNVRPGVHYVGDDACAQCHPGHIARFKQHPMGRSLASTSAVIDQERFDKNANNPFEALGMHFQVERRGQRLIHRETHRDPQGKVLADLEGDVQYVMGSGRQGRSYLINRDGYLFQSPLSWYTAQSIWDLSPGYRKNYHAFGRPIKEQCLFCHSNGADSVEHTVNHYRPPIFHGEAIGCERCHGPGQLHIQFREQKPEAVEFDDTIVNPARLEPALRDAVCQQCHLQGESRIVRRGRRIFDYRPGLPLHLFLSTFVLATDTGNRQKAVGHVEQMAVSRCYRDSKGKMGCITCHDAHDFPNETKKVAYYRKRCLNCHAESSCSEPLPARQAKQPDDSCIACHMAASADVNIAHTAVTDHRILRRLETKPATKPFLLPGQIPLVHFHRDQIDPRDPEVLRDLGLALMEQARRHDLESARQGIAQMASPFLEDALEHAPDDVDTGEAKGYALWIMGQVDEALAATESVLARVPEREVALEDAGRCAAKLGKDDLAITYWKRLLAVNPWHASAHGNIARALVRRKDWPGVLREVEADLRIDPFNIDSRTLLVLYHLRTGNPDRARAEFETILALKPADADKLRRWFAEQARP